MNNGNWIKLNRSILEWEWYDDVNTFRVFVHLLLTANYKPKKWHGIEVDRGQRVISIGNLAEEVGLSVKQTRTALDKLLKTGEITKKGANKYTLITVENYAFYQDVDADEGEQRANKGQTKGEQRANKGQQHKKEKKEKNEKKDKNISPLTPLIETLPVELQPNVWEFVEHRKQIKAPMTELALKKMLNKLNDLSGGDTGKCIAILDQSIANGWKGIFQLDEKKTKTGNKFLDLLAKEQI